jgi:hypothetical protein
MRGSLRFTATLLVLGVLTSSDMVTPALIDFDIACYERERDTPPVRQALARVCRSTDRMHLFVGKPERYKYTALVAIAQNGRAYWLTSEDEFAIPRELAPSNYFSLDLDFGEQPPLGEAKVHAVFSPYPLSKDDVRQAVSQSGSLVLAHAAQTIWWVDDQS